MKEYYKDKWVTIYHGDCREILPQLDVKVDLVLTDPPYPDCHLEYGDVDLSFLNDISCRQIIHWSAKANFPLGYSAIHIWDCKNTIVPYERIFERNGNFKYKLYSFFHLQAGNLVTANFAGDIMTEHPSQKPQKLINRLVTDYSKLYNIILDPFLGSGTTCYCAKKLNRYSIGIEIEEKYCEIAAKRCSQEVMELNI